MPAVSRTTRRFLSVHLALSVLYVASVALASLFIPNDAEPSPAVIVWALLPGLMILGWIVNMGRFLLGLEDEYLRMLEVRKALVATALTLGVCAGWGLVELFADVPRLPVFFVFPMWCAGLVVGTLANRFAFGDSGTCT